MLMTLPEPISRNPCIAHSISQKVTRFSELHVFGILKIFYCNCVASLLGWEHLEGFTDHVCKLIRLLDGVTSHVQGGTVFGPAQFGTLAEAEKIAKKKLPRDVWLAVKAGNEKQWTLDENVEAFERLGFSPTIFNRPLKISTSTSVLSTDISFPVVVSPVGAQAINPGGESAAAAAASQKGTAIGLSSWS